MSLPRRIVATVHLDKYGQPIYIETSNLQLVRHHGGVVGTDPGCYLGAAGCTYRASVAILQAETGNADGVYCGNCAKVRIAALAEEVDRHG